MTSAAPRTAFIDGAFVPFAEARVPVMDRGFLFADSIYEVSAVIDGGLVDNPCASRPARAVAGRDRHRRIRTISRRGKGSSAN